MAQHFLAPVVVLARRAYAHRRSAAIDRGAHPAEAHTAAETQVSDALSALDVDDNEIATVLRAVYELERADRRGIRFGVNRALDIALAAAREDSLATPSTVGMEPSVIYRRDEDGEVFEQTLARVYAARTPVMQRACPRGVYQPGWSRERVLSEARRAGRVLP